MNRHFPQEAFATVVPEVISIFQLRYRILQMISVSGPIGRRSIVDTLKITERVVRNETEILKNQQLIEITQKGMICTAHGNHMLEQLKEVFQEISGLLKKEKLLAHILGIQRVIIVPGNLEDDSNVKQLIGKEAVSFLIEHAKNDDFVAITGGSTVAALADFLAPVKSVSSLTFIAARGSIGDELELQANTLVSQFASKSHANSKTLYLPEHLSQTAYETMKKEPVIKEIIDLYEEVHFVIHGIGNAKEMAVRRHTDNEIIAILRDKQAVGEAFGYYFDINGEIIYQINSIGIQLEQVKNSRNIIAVAGGANKAKAIRAYFNIAAKHTVLITDEGAANAILEG
ncbi:central glycolytic genes regulator [Ureibacillus xyleni]|uniref:Central glycolytic genes regulator n=1 Tax=Ureibacillus xyleni TaxID=614648 RepID=A0A285T6Z9_9BACL|nr:sugar-binding domain-containing protein [Ureibacillus xyleni]SOC17170.1 central glycolytic genes regulator [Ureibacillus xyleni]